MSDVSVLIPFAGEDPNRLLSLAWVTARYEAAGYEVVIGHGDPDRWRKAEAVADALHRSSGDTLVVADSDVWCDELHMSIHAVENGAGWSIPHWNVVRLTQFGTMQWFAGRSWQEGYDEEERHFGVPGGGIVVLPRSMYEECPLDPRFVGWGGEDQAFGYALSVMAGRCARLRAGLWHFWHPPQERATRKIGNDANEELRGRYAGARGSRRAMRELIAEGACRSKVSTPLR